MRPRELIRYDVDGRAQLAVAALDADVVVSARVERETGPACWHFGYRRIQQRELAGLLDRGRGWRSVLIMRWHDAVDPDMDGYHPNVFLTVHLDGETGWAEFSSNERRDDGSHVRYLTAGSALPAPVRLGRDIYGLRPTVPAVSARAVGVEYVATGTLSGDVTWQRERERVPQGLFGRAIVPEDELPPRFP